MNTFIRLQESPARKLVFSTLHRVYSYTEHVQEAFSRESSRMKTPQEEIPLATEIIYGYLRYAIRIDAIIKEHIHKPKTIPKALFFILGVAVYEILYIDASLEHRVIFHTVESIKKRYNIVLSKLTNAVLRNIARKKEIYKDIQYSFSFTKTIEEQYSLQYSLPLFMWKILEERFQEEAHTYARQYLLRPHKTETSINPSTQHLFQVLQLEEFLQGTIWECCSGIGGKRKALEFYDIYPTIVSDNRIEKIVYQDDNNRSLFLCADATKPPLYNESIDTILVDIPCSGLGTLRKRPDIKIHRKEKDIENIIALQKTILHGILPVVKKGGYILYITCSICVEENEKQIEEYIRQTKQVELLRDYTIKTTDNTNDIFYGAVLQKLA